MAKMTLAQIVADTARVTIKGDDYIEVRGLSMADVTTLFKRHTTSLTKAFDDLMDSRAPGTLGVSADDLQEIIQETLTSAPELIGDIIATAMDEPAQARNASKMRAGVQIQALMTIANLSITTEAELKNVVGAAAKIISSVTALFQMARKSRDSH